MTSLVPSAKRPRRHTSVHRNPLVIAAALCLAASLTRHAEASPEHDALLYLDAQVLPRKAAACSARIAGYPARFDPAFRTWLARHKAQVAAGEAFLRADAERTKVPFEPDVRGVAGGIAEQWSAAPLPTLQEQCEALLVQLKDGE